MAGILSLNSDHTESLINPATATATDLSVSLPLQRPQTEAVRTPLIVMVSLPLTIGYLRSLSAWRHRTYL